MAPSRNWALSSPRPSPISHPFLPSPGLSVTTSTSRTTGNWAHAHEEQERVPAPAQSISLPRLKSLQPSLAAASSIPPIPDTTRHTRKPSAFPRQVSISGSEASIPRSQAVPAPCEPSQHLRQAEIARFGVPRVARRVCKTDRRGPPDTLSTTLRTRVDDALTLAGGTRNLKSDSRPFSTTPAASRATCGRSLSRPRDVEISSRGARTSFAPLAGSSNLKSDFRTLSTTTRALCAMYAGPTTIGTHAAGSPNLKSDCAGLSGLPSATAGTARRQPAYRLSTSLAGNPNIKSDLRGLSTTSNASSATCGRSAAISTAAARSPDPKLDRATPVCASPPLDAARGKVKYRLGLAGLLDDDARPLRDVRAPQDLVQAVLDECPGCGTPEPQAEPQRGLSTLLAGPPNLASESRGLRTAAAALYAAHGGA